MIYLITNQLEIPNDTNIYHQSNTQACLSYFADVGEIMVDSETTGFCPHSDQLLTIQLGTTEHQYVIDVKTVDIQQYKELLENKLLVLHNAKFDLKFLYKQGIRPKYVYDTFLAECVLTTGYEERELGLDALSKKYLNKIMDKGVRLAIQKEGLTNRVVQYCADDVKYLSLIKEQQIVKLVELDLMRVTELENDVVKVFAKIEYDGIALDTKKWSEVAAVTNKLVQERIDELDAFIMTEKKLSKFKPKYAQTNMFDEPERTVNINWSSNKQKLAIVKALGCKVESVGDKELQRNKKNHPLINKLIEYNKYNKLSTSFGDNFLKFVNKSTGRIHYNVWQILQTGRISVSGPNLNQIPSKGELGKTIRSCFIPQKDYLIVGGDYSGMELRIIAEFSQDPLWLKAFNDDQDLHSVLCAATFDIPITDVKKDTPFKPGVTYRDVQKTINFGLAYGMSKFKLADTMQIPVGKADEIIKKFFKIVPKVEQFLTNLGNLGKKRGYIRTGFPYRRTRFFPDWEDARNPHNPKGFAIMGSIERASKNSPIQGEPQIVPC